MPIKKSCSYLDIRTGQPLPIQHEGKSEWNEESVDEFLHPKGCNWLPLQEPFLPSGDKCGAPSAQLPALGGRLPFCTHISLLLGSRHKMKYDCDTGFV